MFFYFIFLNKLLNGFDKEQIIIPFSKISTSAVLMGISLYIPLKLFDQFIFDTKYTFQLILLTIIVGFIGTVVYLFFTKIFNVQEINLLYKLLKKLKLTKTSTPIVIKE